MIRRLIGASTVMLYAASCGKPIRCDAYGMIVVPAEASSSEQNELNSRNVDLMNRRAESRLGRSGTYASASLDKATGCP